MTGHPKRNTILYVRLPDNLAQKIDDIVQREQQASPHDNISRASWVRKVLAREVVSEMNGRKPKA